MINHIIPFRNFGCIASANANLSNTNKNVFQTEQADVKPSILHFGPNQIVRNSLIEDLKNLKAQETKK